MQAADPGVPEKATTVFITDIVVAGVRKNNRAPVGEFIPGGVCDQSEPSEKLIDRLYSTINAYTFDAALYHRTSYQDDDAQFLPGHENHVTRLCFNEFFFYPNRPLTLLEFESLMQRVMDNAKEQPSNLHLILASFPVLMPDDKYMVMNVTPQIECGANPKLNVTVKNHPSFIDPVYKYEDSSGRITTCTNAGIKNVDVNHISIVVDTEEHFFDYNSAKICQTAGGVEFYSCLDVCLDHSYGVAKNSLNGLIAENINIEKPSLPIQSAHIVASNTANLLPAHFAGSITHADPTSLDIHCRADAAELHRSDIQHKQFGSDAIMIFTSAAPCGVLSNEQRFVTDLYNQYQVISGDDRNEFYTSVLHQALTYYTNAFSGENDKLKSIKDELNKLDNATQSAVNAMITDKKLPPEKELECRLLNSTKSEDAFNEKNARLNLAQENIAEEWRRTIDKTINVIAQADKDNAALPEHVRYYKLHQLSRQLMVDNEQHMKVFQSQQLDQVLTEFSQALYSIANQIIDTIENIKADLLAAAEPPPSDIDSDIDSDVDNNVDNDDSDVDSDVDNDVDNDDSDVEDQVDNTNVKPTAEIDLPENSAISAAVSHAVRSAIFQKPKTKNDGAFHQAATKIAAQNEQPAAESTEVVEKPTHNYRP